MGGFGCVSGVISVHLSSTTWSDICSLLQTTSLRVRGLIECVGGALGSPKIAVVWLRVQAPGMSTDGSHGGSVYPRRCNHHASRRRVVVVRKNSTNKNEALHPTAPNINRFETQVQNISNTSIVSAAMIRSHFG